MTTERYDVWVKSDYPPDNGAWVQYTVTPFPRSKDAWNWAHAHLADAVRERKVEVRGNP